MSWEPVIGLEIHLELTTKSKMFCRCPADHFGKKPNTQTCPVCLGLPGALPYPNQKAIKWTLLFGLALGCRIPLESRFDRKNYFYPDLPKGYQISQYKKPFCRKGNLKIRIGSRFREIGVNRVHLEEDTGKMIHQEINKEQVSLIDFNRSGVPLVEIVSEPEIRTTEELIAYAQKIRKIARYLKISDGDMEKGQMRFELNLSLKKSGQKGLPDYRVEVKNINSFRFLKKSAEFEIKRQSKLLGKGQTPVQQTRGFDEEIEETFLQRQKEQAHDYRYFPEPDIPPFKWTGAEIEAIKKRLPELPDEKIERFVEDFGIKFSEAEILTRTRKKAKYFEDALKQAEKKRVAARKIANVIINKRLKVDELTPKELVDKLVKRKKRKKLNEGEIEKLVKKVLQKYPDEVLKYKQGKQGLLNFFVGKVMAASRGKADPKVVRKVLIAELE